jgi:hypothetical protein
MSGDTRALVDPEMELPPAVLRKNNPSTTPVLEPLFPAQTRTLATT